MKYTYQAPPTLTFSDKRFWYGVYCAPICAYALYIRDKWLNLLDLVFLRLFLPAFNISMLADE